jgi:hypothetical protein
MLERTICQAAGLKRAAPLRLLGAMITEYPAEDRR